jgi:hypothetical protein
MDLAKDLRAAQAQLDQASAELRDARTTLDSAAAAYDAARRRPGGTDYERARSAWGLALQEWARILIRREGLVDLVAVERRRLDRDGADALLMPTRGGR